MSAKVGTNKRGAERHTAENARTPARWVMLLPSFPPADASMRVKVWRQLQKIGAIALKNSVYVLPNRESCVESFQWLAREIETLGGQASLCEGQFFDDLTDDEIGQRFREARNADFAEVSEEARTIAKTLKAKKLSADKLAAAATQADKLRRRLTDVVAIDFGHATGREAAEGLVSAVERTLREIRGETESEPIERVARPEGATWVTRLGVHIDRVASAWLIKRFIDLKGTFKFVPSKGYVPEPGELRFDMYDAEFTHIGDRCTFEVLLLRMGLEEDAALSAIGEIVHDLDLDDEKYGRPETIGVQSAVSGLCTADRDDLARIASVSPIFDGLYSFFSRSRAGK